MQEVPEDMISGGKWGIEGRRLSDHVDMADVIESIYPEDVKNAERTEGWDERKEATGLSVQLQGSQR